MMKKSLTKFVANIKTSLLCLLIFTLLTGFFYPLFITGVANLFFAWQANGSMVEINGNKMGSLLIGQYFDAPIYFWGRPSATQPFPYNAANSSGSNLACENTNLLTAVKDRVAMLKKTSLNTLLIPIDLVTASASGLDPDISPAAAFYQVTRIAKARRVPENVINALINRLIKKRAWGVLGEPRVNVLELNLALDNLRSNNDRPT